MREIVSSLVRRRASALVFLLACAIEGDVRQGPRTTARQSQMQMGAERLPSGEVSVPAPSHRDCGILDEVGTDKVQ